MRRVKMHDRDVNNSGRHAWGLSPSETRGHMNLAWRRAATPTFPFPPGRFGKNVQRVAVRAPWSVRHRGVLRRKIFTPHFGPVLAHVLLHPSFSGLRCGGLVASNSATNWTRWRWIGTVNGVQIKERARQKGGVRNKKKNRRPGDLLIGTITESN